MRMEIYKNLSDFQKKFYIPSYVLSPDEAEPVMLPSTPPESPILVFINSKSGGQLGRKLILTYRTLLNDKQVFDLEVESPDKVLKRIYLNLERLEDDAFACNIQENLKIIVGGGDGTAGWLLGVVSDLKLSNQPPISTVPLGTGNNLPFAFGWGKKNPGTDRSSVESFLDKVVNAKEMKIDNWEILIRMKAPEECFELPPSLRSFHPLTSSSDNEGYDIYRGGFWNYFSIGMDAQVSYAFHSQRKLRPEKFKHQLVNQSRYVKLTFTEGSVFPSRFQNSSHNIAHFVKVMICNKNGHWNDLHIPQCIKSIICLNLPSFSGGLNPWGTPNPCKKRDRTLTSLFVDDGLIEIVGFKNAWHGLVLLSSKGHGKRLAQANGIRFEFMKSEAKYVYMRMDGEPWKQPLPLDDESMVVEISHHGQVNMLATQNCISKSIYDQPSS